MWSSQKFLIVIFQQRDLGSQKVIELVVNDTILFNHEDVEKWGEARCGGARETR